MNVIVNLDKPKGITSHDAVTEVKRIFQASKAGHAGTLDPIATGVLLICLNEATKVTGYLASEDKGYEVQMKLGERTDTLDAEGEVIERVGGFLISKEEIESALTGFRGNIEQTPPMYSAIKKDGTPLYKLARKGVEVERPPRPVEIKELELVEYSPPVARLRVQCSKGTYIRSLVDDVGRALGVGAHVTALRRTSSGGFGIEGAAGLRELPGREAALIPIDTALGHLRELVLNERDYKLVYNGTLVSAPPELAGFGGFLRLKAPDGVLFAVGKVLNGRLKVQRRLHLS